MANFQPIFPITPKVQYSTITAANTAKDGTGTVVTVFTAGANGSRVDAIKVVPQGTNVATVLRTFVNNGATNATATNNILYQETAFGATTVTEVAAQTVTILKFNGDEREPLSLPAGYKLNITLGTAVAAGLAVTVIGGDY